MQDHLSPAPPPPPAPDSEAGGEARGAKWSPGRRGIVRGPELWRLLKERLKDPNRPAFRSLWQDIELVWRVLRALVARLDLGGMGPSVVRSLDLRRMTLVRKDVSGYVGAVIPFYERWTHRHEFLTRGQRRGETVEEYFRAKRDLLMDGDAYGDMIAAYPAYWSGLRRLELVILMDTRVLGHIWPGQILDRDPQIEEWATNTAPDMGALQKLLSNLETSGLYGRKCGLSARVGAKASERRGALVGTPRG